MSTHSSKVRFKHGDNLVEKEIETLVGTQRQHAIKAIKKRLKIVRFTSIAGAMLLTLGVIFQVIGTINR